MRHNKSCLICGGDEPKYTFKCCKRRFCSMDCFKSHDECDHPSQSSNQPLPHRRIIRADNFDLGLAEDEILPDFTLESLQSDPGIVDLLSDPTLQRMLLRLDQAKDRRQMFQRMIDTSPIFSQLVDRLAKTIGFEQSD